MKIPKIPARLSYLLVALLFCLQLTLHITAVLNSCVNFRIETKSNLHSGCALAKKWYGVPASATQSVEADDDVGAAYAVGAAIFLSHTKEQITRGEVQEIPSLYFFFVDLIYFITLVLFLWSLSGLVGENYAAAFVAIILLSKNINYIAFFGDVYLFPVFSIASIFCWIRLMKDRPRSALFLAPCFASLLFLSDLFRTSIPFLVGPLLLLLAFPKLLQPSKYARAGAAFFLVTLLFLKFTFAPAEQHPIWQSIHAGFFEFGGRMNAKEKKALPNFMIQENDTSLPQPVSDWEDKIEEMLLRTKYPEYALYGAYKKEYGNFFKETVIDIIKQHPEGVARLLLKRIWQISVVNPWQSTKYWDGPKMSFQEPRDSLIRAIVFIPILFALFTGILSSAFSLILLSLMLQIAPLLLVYSGYLTYSAPYQVTMLMLWLFSIRHLVNRKAMV